MGQLWELLVEPVARYGFMRYGLATAVVVGVTSALLSCLLVVRRWALLGDAIAHAVLLGVTVGWLAAGHVGLFWGALAAGVITGVGIAYIERNSRVKHDAAMGVVFTFAFALGIAIISMTRPRGIDLFHILFGNILGVGPAELALTATSGGFVLLAVLALYKPLHLWTFDPVMAQVAGLRVGALQYVFTVMLSATIVAALQAVGLVLVIAMLITPGATAYLLAERLSTMMAVAAGVGLLAAIGGLYGSFYVDVASGPAMVVLATLLFALAFLFAPNRGVASQALRRRRAIRRAAEEDLLRAVFKATEEPNLGQSAALPTEGLDTDEQRHKTAHRLFRKGLLERTDDGVRVSAAGRHEALRLMRSHRLLEEYLAKAEGFALEELHEEADRREHLLRPEAVEELDRALGHPRTDPHGHPIPTPDGQLARIAGRTLLQAPPGSRGRVLMVSDDRDDLLREMRNLGIVPDTRVTVASRADGQSRLEINGRDVHVTDDIAARVYIKVEA